MASFEYKGISSRISQQCAILSLLIEVAVTLLCKVFVSTSLRRLLPAMCSCYRKNVKPGRGLLPKKLTLEWQLREMEVCNATKQPDPCSGISKPEAGCGCGSRKHSVGIELSISSKRVGVTSFLNRQTIIF